jgi:cleavage and polyadenylation specificity factor subunit 6/7
MHGALPPGGAPPGPPRSLVPPPGPIPHVNPAFFPPHQGPPPGHPPPNSFPPGLPPPGAPTGLSEVEFEEIMSRNRTVSSSAIARAVQGKKYLHTYYKISRL